MSALISNADREKIINLFKTKTDNIISRQRVDIQARFVESFLAIINKLSSQYFAHIDPLILRSEMRVMLVVNIQGAGYNTSTEMVRLPCMQYRVFDVNGVQHQFRTDDLYIVINALGIQNPNLDAFSFTAYRPYAEELVALYQRVAADATDVLALSAHFDTYISALYAPRRWTELTYYFPELVSLQKYNRTLSHLIPPTRRPLRALEQILPMAAIDAVAFSASQKIVQTHLAAQLLRGL